MKPHIKRELIEHQDVWVWSCQSEGGYKYAGESVVNAYLHWQRYKDTDFELSKIAMSEEMGFLNASR